MDLDINNHILIGKILKPRGLAGEVKILSFSDFPERFKALEQVKIFNQDETFLNILKLKKVRFYKDFVYIFFENINSREEADNFKNCFLCVEESERWKLPKKDMYYFSDLRGCKVKYTQNLDFQGFVKEVERFPANDILIIHDDKGTEYMIPFVNEFVGKVNIKAQEIEILRLD